METYSLDEINPALKECIMKFLNAEYQNLPRMERFIVDHGLYSDTEDVMNKIWTVFNDLRFKHLNTKRIQDYMERH